MKTAIPFVSIVATLLGLFYMLTTMAPLPVVATIFLVVASWIGGSTVPTFLRTDELTPRRRPYVFKRIIDSDNPTMKYVVGSQKDIAERYWKSGTSKEEITHVAILHPDGRLYIGEAPARHSDVIKAMYIDHADGIENTQNAGFLTSRGRFVNRFEAAVLAEDCGQRRRVTGGDSRQLYSEDLW